jgi:hypothetical protein
LSATLVQVCSDPRLDHGLIRQQVGARLQQMALYAERIFILNEAGGNLGSSFASTLTLLQRRDETIVLAAVLHHDDCLAAAEGLRQPIALTVAQLKSALAAQHIYCPVLSGQIETEHSAVQWSDAPRPNFELIPFRMPRLHP